jgi:CubicO group peptidase (beta-lactamase class C family)
LDPSECFDQVICPIYKGDESAFKRFFGIDKSEFESAPDMTCGPFKPEERKACMEYATKRNFCTLKPHIMRDKCFFACSYTPCEKTIDTVGAHTITKDIRWEYRYNEELKQIIKTESGFVYDNFGYTILDAIIYRKTNKFLAQWVKELVFDPLGMKGSSRCLKDLSTESLEPGEEDFECLTPPATVLEWHKGDVRPWTRGQMTQGWVSNTFFASTEDLRRFLGMLLRNGTKLDSDERLLTEASINSIFTPRYIAKRPLGTAVGMQAYGLGVGYCDRKEVRHPHPFKYDSKVSRAHPQALGGTICTSERTWGWGSSHGSRVILLRDKNVACAAMLNTPNKGEPPTRAHFIGHNISAMMRDVFGL